MIIFYFFNAVNVCASEVPEARIGNRVFTTLEEAINASTSLDTIILASNVSLDNTLEIHKTVNINLNNHNITAPQKVFLIQGGSLNLSGSGKISETNPNYGAIMLLGSDDPTKKDFSTISVGSGVTLEGWSGIFINQYNKTGYGILVNMNGKINAIDDVGGGSGSGIYVNGSIQHEDNSPIINLSDTARITSSGSGIYAAGYATYNINGAYISGIQSGLGIKSGTFNILDGTIKGTGEDKTPTGGNNNGINASGTAIQIESNPGYKGNIKLTIKDGNFESNHSNVIYEYVVNNTSTQVKDISISGGTFISKANKDVISASNSFKSIHNGFISGGKYSSNPTNYLMSGYSVQKDSSDLYEVISSTMGVFLLNKGSTNYLSTIITIISLFIIGLIIYLNRKRILTLIK